jgi:hypothetical protein
VARNPPHDNNNNNNNNAPRNKPQQQLSFINDIQAGGGCDYTVVQALLINALSISGKATTTMEKSL